MIVIDDAFVYAANIRVNKNFFNCEFLSLQVTLWRFFRCSRAAANSVKDKIRIGRVGIIKSDSVRKGFRRGRVSLRGGASRRVGAAGTGARARRHHAGRRAGRAAAGTHHGGRGFLENAAQRYVES